MTPARLRRIEEIEARVKAATPGPWRVDSSYQSPTYIRAENRQMVASAHVIYDKTPLPYFANASFIAHARSDVEWLLTELRAAMDGSAVMVREAPEPTPGGAKAGQSVGQSAAPPPELRAAMEE
jgi:hypothetical protein